MTAHIPLKSRKLKRSCDVKKPCMLFCAHHCLIIASLLQKLYVGVLDYPNYPIWALPVLLCHDNIHKVYISYFLFLVLQVTYK